MDKKDSVMRRYLSFQRDRYLTIAIFIFILGFTTFPLIALTTYGNYQQITASYNFFSITALLLLSCAFIFPVILFSFTNVKGASDLYFSLPIKRQNIFLHNFLLGIILVLLPITLSTAFGILVLVIKGSPFFLTYLVIYAQIVLLYIVIYSFVTLIVQVCNNRFDSYLSGILVINLPIIIYYAVIVFLETSILGFPYYNNHDLITMLSPVYSIFRIWYQSTFLPSYIFYLLLAIILPAIASSFFYKRRAEHSQEASTSFLVYPLIKYILTFATLLLSLVLTIGYNFGPISKYFFATFCSFIVFIVISAIANRGFKNFFKLIRIFIIYALVILIPVVSCQITNGYGIFNNIPNDVEINSIDFTQDSLKQIFADYNYRQINRDTVAIKSNKVIKIVELIQEDIINDPQSYSEGTPVTLSFTYNKDHTSSKWRYIVPEEKLTLEFYQAILESKAWLPSYQFLFENDSSYKVITITNGLKTNQIQVDFDNSANEKVTKALISDLNKLDYRTLYQNKKAPISFLTFNNNESSYTCPIYEEFKETISTLKELNIVIYNDGLKEIKDIKIVGQTNRVFSSGDYLTQIYQNPTNTIDIPKDQWNDVVKNLSYNNLSTATKKVVAIYYNDERIEIFQLVIK